jgi:hypothetical protein
MLVIILLVFFHVNNILHVERLMYFFGVFSPKVDMCVIIDMQRASIKVIVIIRVALRCKGSKLSKDDK